MITHCFTFSTKFSTRLVFLGTPERNWDYAQLNSKINKNEPVNVAEFPITHRSFEFGQGGISGNVQRGLAESGYDAQKAKRVLFEILQAGDEESRQKGATLDSLESRLKLDKVTQFSLENGYLYFFDEKGEEILKLKAISDRQKAFKESFYAKTTTLEHTVDTHLVEKETRRQLRRELRRTAIESLPAPDNQLSVSVRLPQLPKNPPFIMPGQFWIETSKAPPEGLMRAYRSETACMGYVGERLRQRLGASASLRDLGFEPGIKAWQFKSELMKKGGVSVVSSMQKYLSLSGGTIRNRNVGTPQYKQDLLNFRGALDEKLAASSTNAPFVLTMRYRDSDYAGKSAAYNARLPRAQRSLNTHILEGLGKGKRKLPWPPQAGEELTTYAHRALAIKPKDGYLLSAVTLWVDDQPFHYDKGQRKFVDDKGEAKRIDAKSHVLLEDVYFAHHFKGAHMDSLTALLASGKYDPVDILALNMEQIKKPAATPKFPEGVSLQTSFYLRRKENIRKRFSKISKDPDDWERACWFWKEIGFDTGRVKADIEPVPIPHLGQLKALVDKKGGLSELRAITHRARIAEYNTMHPGEHVLRVESGQNPWSLVSSFFEGKFTPELSHQEKSSILAAIDRFNASIDLRIIAFPGEGAKTQKDYVRFQEGDVAWVSDELLRALENNLRYERDRTQVHVPSTLLISTEKRVEINDHERQVIETATADPQIRLLLTLALLNEQKRGSRRGQLAKLVEQSGLRDELSVGLFQVQVRDNERLLVNKQGYNFPTLESYRNALKTDDILNAKVAQINLQEASDSYRHFLSQNHESPQPTDPHFLSGVLTAYNRPRGRLYAGLFTLMASRVSTAFSLSLDPQGPIDRNHSASTVQFWHLIGEKLLNEKLISLPGGVSQIQRDVAFLNFNKIDFFETALFKSVNRAYEKKIGTTLSFLIQDSEYQTSPLQNYGYRATRHGQVAEILSYSSVVNQKNLQGRQFIDLDHLPSIQSKNGNPGIATKTNLESLKT